MLLKKNNQDRKVSILDIQMLGLWRDSDMMPVTGYDQFLDQFESVKDKSRLFMFILFDSRPSHHSVETFIEANFGWLDSLAASVNMFGFAFFKLDDQGEVETNPSLRVAHHFGIQPNELPGVVAFTMLPNSPSVSNAVYLPMKAKLFEKEKDIVEDVFADIFSIFGEALGSTETEGELIEMIKENFEDIRRKEQRRPVFEYLGERARSLATLPEKLLEAAAISFGGALGGRIGS